MTKSLGLSRSRFGRYRNNDPVGTKATLVWLLEAKGLTLTIERENVGAWNECRNFKVGDVVLDSAMKKDKPDWDYMIKAAEKI
jgi:hypothetical protein